MERPPQTKPFVQPQIDLGASMRELYEKDK